MARLTTLKPRVAMLKPNRVQTTAGTWRTNDMTSSDRGYGYKWQQARERFLRAHPLCCYCERDGYVTAATVVDHRIPHRGDQALFWDEANWMPLCATCHSSTKQREEKSGTLRPRIGLDGWPVE